MLSAAVTRWSLHIPAKMSAFNSHMRQNATARNLKRTFEDLLPCYCRYLLPVAVAMPMLPCYCYETKVNSRTFAPQFRNLPLQAKKRIKVNCKLITA